MARSVSEIKTSIGDNYLTHNAVQTFYNLTDEDVALGFDVRFSKVSIESILFYTFAFAINTFERILDTFRIEIQTKIDAAFVANKAWWHAEAMKFQKGYELILNPKTFVYEYANNDPAAQIIKRVAVRQKVDPVDNRYKVFLYVAGELSGAIQPISVGDLDLFNAYADRKKPAGVQVRSISDAGDTIDFGLTVNYNPMLLSSAVTEKGKSFIGQNYPVNEAIEAFITTLNTTNFGGNLNLTRLVDEIQKAEGVIDVYVTAFHQNGISKQTWGTFESANGWFVLGDINIDYQPQTEL